jgi:hypothetical protein
MRPKQPGRPSVDPAPPDVRGPSVYMHLTLSARQYDAAYRQARERRMTVPEFLRFTLRHASAPSTDPPR